MKRHAPMVLSLMLALTACGGPDDPAHGGDDHGHGDHGHAEARGHDAHGDGHDEAPRGAHGGRLLEQRGYRVELAIAEAGTPPRFQAWLYRGDAPLAPATGRVDVTLTRLGGVIERHVLAPQADGSLKADTIVGEPHSFDVDVRATIGGDALRWTYASYEGRTEIAADIAREAGIVVAPAGPGEIADEHEVQGLLATIDGRVAAVMARFPGPIRSVDANIGDVVKRGQVLATIESNLSLSTYAITSPIAGTVLARRASLGGVAGEGTALFDVADLSQLSVDLHVFGADMQHIVAGVPVTVTRMTDGVATQATLERVLPGAATASQSTIARATIANDDGLWRPGAAVRARITVQRKPAAIVVPLSALQRLRDWDVVFIRVGDTYEVRPLTLGERDATRVEVLDGLAAGDLVVVEQSYVVKADIEKSGASHDH